MVVHYGKPDGHFMQKAGQSYCCSGKGKLVPCDPPSVALCSDIKPWVHYRLWRRWAQCSCLDGIMKRSQLRSAAKTKLFVRLSRQRILSCKNTNRVFLTFQVCVLYVLCCVLYIVCCISVKTDLVEMAVVSTSYLILLLEVSSAAVSGINFQIKC